MIATDTRGPSLGGVQSDQIGSQANNEANNEVIAETVDRAGTMQAILRPRYGDADALQLASVARPVAGDDEVLIRVRAAAIGKGDVHLLTGKPYLLRLMTGLRRPKHARFGQDLAGVVAAVGSQVRDFQVGDAVFGQAGMALGAFAEFVAVPAAQLALKPAGLSFEQAAAVPDSASTALQGLRDAGRLQPGQRVLINGASGGVGSFAVQIARALGAEVTAVCSSRHVDAVRGLGAARVIDYTREDFAAGGERYDLILDLVGNRALADIRSVLTADGVYVASTGRGGDWFGPLLWLGRIMLANLFSRRTLRTFLVNPNQADLRLLADLIEAGKVSPLIEGCFPLGQAARAIAHVAGGHAQGKTVIAVAGD